MSEDFHTQFHHLLRVTRKKLGLTQEEMGKRLGVSGNWISLLESGKEEKARPSEQLILLLKSMPLDQSAVPESTYTPRDEPIIPYGKRTALERMIPVIGWAHAGLAESYEEIPEDWQDKVPSTIRDEKAFAVRLEGDSMEPKYSAGDVLILQPSLEPYNGCLAVIKMKSDGFLFRRIERRTEFVRLIPLNPQWGSEDLPLDQITWIFPVWGMWRQILK